MINTLLIIMALTQAPIDSYNRGNECYKNGDFESAIESYEMTLTSVQHPDPYYNLGNAYFKQGKMGKAIVNFQRALFLAPRDQDINFNLTFARNYRIDKMRIAENPFSAILHRASHMLSMFESQLITTILFLIAMFLVSLYVITRRSLYGYMCIGGVVLCLYVGGIWIAWSNTLHAQHAVIIAPEINALSGPGLDYKEILVLHDGAEVRIRETRGDFALIQIPGGMGGWVPVTSLEEVF
ncbi:tetratricopeptide repeat protein [candidate division WOR-3 bacterium]|nr:tetratricopeptide repeat protein [candidate division WOR-3 bacterium]